MATRKRTVFVCSECGHGEPKWAGQCPACGAWNTMNRLVVDEARPGGARARGGHADVAQAVRLSAVSTDVVRRLSLGIGELDRVLGGGVVPGSLVLIAGEPGIGKSTLILQASALLAETAGPVLYVSGEESAQQIKLRARRTGLDRDDLYVMPETNLDAVLDEIARLAPRAVVVDSIQTMYLDAVESSAGSVTQVRECAARLARLAKAEHVPVFLVGHVTKTGDIAGPRVLEHMVDVVLYLEGDRFHTYRLLRCVKNRFGATNEVGVFEMRSEGMAEVTNPSAAFLAERLPGVPGSAVTVTMEGTRPLLVEIQALVGASGAQVPRRTSNGIDFNRLLLLIAVLSRRLGLPLGNQDVFVNVVGGLKVSEPAVDLAVAVAIASSARGIALPDDLVIVGEIGLSGELRSVGQIERRLSEAAKLGYHRALVPSASLRGRPEVPDLTATGARTVVGALEVALGAKAQAPPAGDAPAAPE
jgi:DNA repair protein RadA/Sms